jgi:hypothetical protein
LKIYLTLLLKFHLIWLNLKVKKIKIPMTPIFLDNKCLLLKIKNKPQKKIKIKIIQFKYPHKKVKKKMMTLIMIIKSTIWTLTFTLSEIKKYLNIIHLKLFLKNLTLSSIEIAETLLLLLSILKIKHNLIISQMDFLKCLTVLELLLKWNDFFFFFFKKKNSKKNNFQFI